MNHIGVPVLLVLSSIIMALAWLGHVRLRHRPFRLALLISWGIALPEYVLNVVAFRWGSDVYSGAQMAAFNTAAGVLCVALVARLFLGERIRRRQWAGFVLMAAAMVLIRLP